MRFEYLHLPVGSPPPDPPSGEPFKAVVIAEQAVPQDWQNSVSRWLIASDCLYMMAWGPDSSSWDESVDWAKLEAADFQDVPDDKFTMTTWHDDEPLTETFWFAVHGALHPSVELGRLLIIDLHADARSNEMLDLATVSTSTSPIAGNPPPA